MEGKSAYLAIGYLCNENCMFCPCAAESRTEKKTIPGKVIFKRLSQLAEEGIKQVTLSGGEPTLHPAFVEIISFCQLKGIHVYILSNSEQFSSDDFMANTAGKVDWGRINVITTLHSQDAFEHEAANRTHGSWGRSVSGLLKLLELGADVTLKHCITKSNYRDLLEFYDYFDSVFPERTDFQMCGIDYCGVSENELMERGLSFPEMRENLEQMLDRHIERMEEGSSRRLYCIHLPLCSCDPYYWKFLRREDSSYSGYIDPDDDSLHIPEQNAGVDFFFCGSCRVKSVCPGTYRTVFSKFGGALVKPYI